MRYIGVCGSRSYTKYPLLKKALDALKSRYTYITIVTGGANGADKLAAWWAQQNNVNCIVYEADWSIGKHAGFVRNHQIIEKSDELLACFVPTKPCNGTRHTVSLAEASQIPVTFIGVEPRR